MASLTRETGPKVVRGDPAGKKEGQTVTHSGDHHYYIPSLGISDSALKFTHVLYNLSPAGKYIFLYHFLITLQCALRWDWIGLGLTIEQNLALFIWFTIVTHYRVSCKVEVGL